MKKKFVCLTIMLIGLFVLSVNSYATVSANISTASDKTSIKAGDTVNVTLDVSNVADAQNDFSISITSIKYDRDVFESLTSSNVTTTFKDATVLLQPDSEEGDTLLVSSDDITGGKITIAFKAKSTTVKTGTLGISFEDATIASTGNNSTADITVNPVSVTLTATESEEQEKEEPETKEDKEENGDIAKSTEYTGKKLADTGIKNTVILLIAVVSIAAIVFAIKYKKAIKY